MPDAQLENLTLQFPRYFGFFTVQIVTPARKIKGLTDENFKIPGFYRGPDGLTPVQGGAPGVLPLHPNPVLNSLSWFSSFGRHAFIRRDGFAQPADRDNLPDRHNGTYPVERSRGEDLPSSVQAIARGHERLEQSGAGYYRGRLHCREHGFTRDAGAVLPSRAGGIDFLFRSRQAKREPRLLAVRHRPVNYS